MELALASVLEQRSAQLETRLHRKRSVVLSLGLHVLLLSSFLISPLLLRHELEPIEFTPITIVPVQALGVEEPAAPPPRREAPSQPEPEVTAPKVDPEPQPEAPTVRDPEPKAPAESTPQRQRQSAATSSADAQRPAGDLGQRKGSPMGSSLGTSAFGAAVGGLDNPDFVYGYYVDQMLAMIGAHWQRPPLGAEIQAVIHFRIHSDGHISDVRIAQSSGYNSYDLAGLRAVQLAAPFPKLPQSYKHGSLGVNLILR